MPAGRRGTGIWRFVRQQNGTWAHERLLIVALDGNRQVVCVREVSRTQLTPAGLRRAIKSMPLARTGGLVSIHNRPRADPRSANSHREIARRLKEVADALGVPVLDHLVFRRGRYQSMVHRRPR